MRGQKYDFETVKADFEKKGYKLLETKYKNIHTKMKYQCLRHPDKILETTYQVLLSG